MALSTKAQREGLRERLLDEGRSVSQIAAEMARRFNVRPRVAWRYALGWPQWKLVQELRAAAPGLAVGDNRISEWEAWPYGGARPSLENLIDLADAFGHGCTVSDLVDAVDLAHSSAAELRYLEFARASAVDTAVAPATSYPGTRLVARAPGSAADTSADVAAHESWWHLAAGTAAVDPAGVDMVQDAVLRLARRYDTLAPSQVLAEARQTRDLSYGLLDRTRRPAQQVDLTLVAGMSCALLAGASFDLGRLGPAAAQARAAARYAGVIGHSGLTAWSLGCLSLLTYWSGRPREAVQIADEALAASPGGSASARLHAIRARAWALLGDVTEVTEAVQRADDLLAASGGPEELHDEIGGEFAWGAERNSMCAGTALVTVGDPAGGADRLREVIAAPGTVSRSILGQPRTDLATAELAAGQFDAAIDQLQDVWTTPLEQRRVGLTGRLDRMRGVLGEQRWKTYRPAGALRDQIEAFTTEAVSHRALLAADDGPAAEIAAP